MSQMSVYIRDKRDNKRSDKFNETTLSRAKTTKAAEPFLVQYLGRFAHAAGPVCNFSVSYVMWV